MDEWGEWGALAYIECPLGTFCGGSTAAENQQFATIIIKTG